MFNFFKKNPSNEIPVAEQVVEKIQDGAEYRRYTDGGKEYMKVLKVYATTEGERCDVEITDKSGTRVTMINTRDLKQIIDTQRWNSYTK